MLLPFRRVFVVAQVHVVRLHHVQVACPPGGEDAARRFYAEGLGLTEVAKPAELAGRGGVWFRSYDDAGAVVAELHVGVEEPFAPARKAHPAFLLADVAELEAAAARLTALGYDVDVRERHTFPGYERFHAYDGARQPGRGAVALGLRGSSLWLAVTIAVSGRSLGVRRGLNVSQTSGGSRRCQIAPDRTLVVNRVKRAQGQLAGVLRMIEEGRDVQEVVNQLKAVTRALDRAGFAIIAMELREAIAQDRVDDDELARLEALYLSLA